MFIFLLLIIPVFDADVDDVAGGLCVGKIQGGSTIEFNVLCRDANTTGKEVAVNIEDFHSKATWLGNPIVEARVAGFGAITADDRVFGAVVEHTLFEMGGELVVDDEFPFHNALGASVCS